jgi:hypothetical protein
MTEQSAAEEALFRLVDQAYHTAEGAGKDRVLRDRDAVLDALRADAVTDVLDGNLPKPEQSRGYQGIGPDHP